MSCLKQTVAKSISASPPQLSFTRQKSNHNIKQCEVRLGRDPLLIPKQEIDQNKLPSSMISLTATRKTAAEVFITAATSLSTDTASAEVDTNNILPHARAKYKCPNCSEKFCSYIELTKHKMQEKLKPEGKQDDDHDDDDGNYSEGDNYDDDDFVLDTVDILTGVEQDRENVDKILQHKYTCSICYDTCIGELDYENHMKFHLELSQANDKHKNSAEPIAFDTNSPSCENVAAITESSQSCSPPKVTLRLKNKSHNLKGNLVVEIAENCIASGSQQTDKVSNHSLLSTDEVRAKIVPVDVALPSNGNTAITSVPTRPVAKNRKAITAEFRTVPIIPIGQCTCPLEKLKSTCDFCLNGPKYICGNCKEEFKTHLLLETHVRDIHRSATRFCQECGRGFSRSSSLKQHMNRHKGLFTCYLCVSSFKEKHEFEEHILTHRIKCDQCDMICSNKNELSGHILEVHKGVTYTCGDCSKTFKKYSLLKVHRHRYHRMGEYKCKECDKIFKSLKLYHDHTYRHRLKKQVICEQCGREFASALYLKAHRMAMHLKKKYTCKVCKKEFSSTAGRMNCQNKHAGIAKYKCDMCEKAFYYYASLVIHKRTHTGENPYFCFVCERRFYSTQMLFKHGLSHGIPEKELRQRLKTAYQPEKQK